MWLVLFVAMAYVLACPYNKVEESFNTQAVHDAWLVGPSSVDSWDHKTFPGTVPRTFLGALFIAACSKLTYVAGSKQIWSRMVLAVWWFAAFSKFAKGVRSKFGNEARTWLCLLTVSQFHQIFYSSRLLPNTLALVPTLWAYGAAMLGNKKKALGALVATTAVFRCDLAAIAVPLGASWTSFRWWVEEKPDCVPLHKSIFVAAVAALTGASLSIFVDSKLWGRTTWPEAQVFLFNNPVDNRSAEWGVSPWHWYATSALPRALGTAFPLAFVGLATERRVRGVATAALVSICLLSILPHKELRFIFPALPLLNLSAAVALSANDPASRKKRPRRIAGLRIFGAACLAFNLALTINFARAAFHNYPGGVALHTLNSLDPSRNRSVHIDVAACVSGVSRFGERPDWQYDKSEDLTEFDRFDYRIAPTETRGFHTLQTIEGYSSFKLDLAHFPFLHLVTKPALLLLRHDRFLVNGNSK